MDPTTVDEFPGFFYDVSGDERASALDALRVINKIARATAEGEGEPSLLTPLATGSVLPADTESAGDETAVSLMGSVASKIASFDHSHSNVDEILVQWANDDSLETEEILALSQDAIRRSESPFGQLQ